MPHEFYFVKNKERRDRRTTNLMFKNHERMLKAIKKLKKEQQQLFRSEPLYPAVMKKMTYLRTGT
jgi:hypothetical protein